MPRVAWLLFPSLAALAGASLFSAASESPVMLPDYNVVAPPLVALGVTTHLRANFFSGRVSSLTITRVLAGSAGAKAGLKAGDEIVSLRGRPITGLRKPEVIALGRIPTGGELRLGLRSKDDQAPRNVVLKMTPPRLVPSNVPVQYPSS